MLSSAKRKQNEEGNKRQSSTIRFVTVAPPNNGL